MCIYMYMYYIYIYQFENVLDKLLSISLQKLRQYNKNLRKHQTKINAAINTN